MVNDTNRSNILGLTSLPVLKVSFLCFLMAELICVFCSLYAKQIKEELIRGAASWLLEQEVTCVHSVDVFSFPVDSWNYIGSESLS